MHFAGGLEMHFMVCTLAAHIHAVTFCTTLRDSRNNLVNVFLHCVTLGQPRCGASVETTAHNKMPDVPVIFC